MRRRSDIYYITVLVFWLYLVLCLGGIARGDYRVTAYCSCEKCCGKWSKYKTTASGHKIQKGDRFVAAPKSISFGTMVVIKGYNDNKPVMVLDRGGAIKGERLDVYFDTHKEALEWGVRYIDVKWLGR